jgi:hypothetical protein
MVLAFLLACGPTRKIGQIRQQELAATLALSRNEIEEERKVIAVARRDTLTVQDEGGNTVLIMKAVKDQASGEMVATDVLDAAVITARFRNVAERNGRIDLRFEIIVPALMQDTRWQLRFYPDMFILDDSLRLEPVLITGREYRQQQLRGYQQYEKFLRSIITDSTRFLDYRNLDIFIRRNIPELFALKADSSFVSDEVFHSLYGVTEQAAIAHYTNQFGKSLNERRKSRQDAMYARYVKVPIVTEGIRLDTVLQNANGDFVYHYTQRIATRPKLRKVDVVLSGEIFESDHRLYTMVRSQPLTFYISSLSSLTDGTERYLTRTIERRAAANTACYVDFRSGKWEVEPTLGNNREELARIRENIVQLLSNPTFELDSIVIGASASPEGAQAANDALAKQRAGSVADYFDRFIRSYRDSVQRALNEEARNTFTLTVGDDGKETVGRVKARKADLPAIPFRSRSAGENWDLLSFLVDSDSTLTASQKMEYTKCLQIKDLDQREKELSQSGFYPRLREVLYPRLRTVRFDFFLHRRGMIKESVQTTELDTTYMKGVAALKDRDYKLALTYLKDYKDFNTAIAYVSLDYNASAMAILQELERTPPVNYMLAILYARSQDDQNAVQCYLDACKQDHSYVFRGNLDPEIYVLIQRYGLHKEEDD